MDNNNYYNPTPGYASATQAQSAQSLQAYVAQVMRRVFGKMFLGLLITALTALGVASSPTLLGFIFSSKIVFFGLIIAELALVFVISAAINRLSSTAATLLFYLYAVLNGAMLCSIFFAYSTSVIALTFAVTSLTFGAMAAYGYITRQDLSKMGAILFMGLIGLIIASIVNIFLGSSTLEWIVSILGVVIFTGLTAWDVQKIKDMASMTDTTQAGKVATIGALSLYLDFINLFLYMLRIFGRDR